MYKAILAIFIAILPNFVLADQAAHWRNVGAWGVYVDRAIGNGCYASTSYRDGLHIRVGYNPNMNGLFILMSNSNWQSMQVGDVYNISFVFSRRDSWNGNMEVKAFGNGEKYLVMNNVREGFVADFMRKNSVDVRYQGRSLSYLSLRGSSRAFQETTNCQYAMGRGASPDPFSSNLGHRNPRDPFS